MLKYFIFLLVVSGLVIIPDTGHSEDIDELPCPVESVPAVTGLDPQTVDYNVAWIYVVFPDELPDVGYMDTIKRHTVPDGFSEFLYQQSRGQYNAINKVIDNPDSLVPEGYWVADYPASMYAHPDNVEVIARYDSCYCEGSEGFCHAGELQAEILHKIWTTYEAEYGVGNFDNPFDDVDFIFFFYKGQALWAHPVGNYFGYGSLMVEADCFPFLSNVATQPIVDPPVVRGIVELGYESSNYRLFEHVIAHEFGHNIGRIHSLSHDRGTNYTHDLESYYYGSYSAMRKTLIRDQGYLPYHLMDLYEMDWYDPPERISGKNIRIDDIRLSGKSYRMDIDAGTGEYFVIAYHGGYGEDAKLNEAGGPIYPSTGLAIWHVAPHVSGEEIWDLESASGMYSDPQIEGGLGGWSSQDRVSGYDNHDVFPVLGDPGNMREQNEARLYDGAATDFFSIANGTDEFSFKTNPHTYGYSGNLRRSPQDVPNSIFIKIREYHGTHLIVDLLYAPTQEMTSPRGGGEYPVGSVVPIRWNVDEDMGITDVSIRVRLGSTVFELESHIDNDGEYDWHTQQLMDPTSCEIELLFYNPAVPDEPAIVSSGEFLFCEPSIAQYDNVSGYTQLDYSGTPYSSVTLDYDDDGLLDLFVAIDDNDSQLYKCDGINSDGIPEFVAVSTSVFMPLESPQPGLRGLAVADYDNDGYEDIYAGADIGNNPRLYRYDHDSSKFIDMATAVGIVPNPEDIWSAVWLDYDDDGLVDLLLGGTEHVLPGFTPDSFADRSVRLMKNDIETSGMFVDRTYIAGLGGTEGAFLSITSADVDADGDQDVFLASISDDVSGVESSSQLLINSGDGTFTKPEMQTRFPDHNLMQGISAASFMDLDNDSDLDLLLTSQSRSPELRQWVLFNNGQGYYNQQEYLALSSAGYVQGHGVLDHDLDGDMDIVLLPESDVGRPSLHSCAPYDGAVQFYDVTSAIGLDDIGEVHGVTARDWNADGDVDMYLGRPSGGNKFFYRAIDASGLDAVSNNWLGIRLEGTGANNESSIGAKVVVSYDGNTPMQYVDGGSARGGQRGRDLIYGLGGWDNNVNVFVFWPNGHSQMETFSGAQLDTVRTVYDTSPPGVIESSIKCTKNMLPGQVEWVITWNTVNRSRAELDQVEISGPGFGSPSTYYSDPGSIVKNADGTYCHTVSFTKTCVQGRFQYAVSSSTDLITSSSQTHRTSVSLCISP